LKGQFDSIRQYDLLDNPLQVRLFTGYADVFTSALRQTDSPSVCTIHAVSEMNCHEQYKRTEKKGFFQKLFEKTKEPSVM